jgi:hypothetical protein
MQIFLLILLAYFLYKFIFGFILPIYKTTKQVKKQFGEMKEKINEQFSQSNNYTQTSTEVPPPKSKSKDYIDFEEVKE